MKSASTYLFVCYCTYSVCIFSERMKRYYFQEYGEEKKTADYKTVKLAIAKVFETTHKLLTSRRRFKLQMAFRHTTKEV